MKSIRHFTAYCLRMCSLPLCSIALLLAGTVAAADFSYTNISLTYEEIDFNQLESDYPYTGFTLQGQVQLSESAFVYAKAVQWTNDEFNFEPEIQSFDLGIGGIMPISGAVDLNFGIGYAQQIEEFGNLIDIDQSGFVISGAVLAQLNQSFEFELGFDNYFMDGDTETVADLALRFTGLGLFAPQIVATTSNDVQAFGVGAQLRF